MRKVKKAISNQSVIVCDLFQAANDVKHNYQPRPGTLVGENDAPRTLMDNDGIKYIV